MKQINYSKAGITLLMAAAVVTGFFYSVRREEA